MKINAADFAAQLGHLPDPRKEKCNAEAFADGGKSEDAEADDVTAVIETMSLVLAT